jgi:hypothetical protein
MGRAEGKRMSNRIYDIITVGGGLGGAAIAKAMAEYGARSPDPVGHMASEKGASHLEPG